MKEYKDLAEGLPGVINLDYEPPIGLMGKAIDDWRKHSLMLHEELLISLTVLGEPKSQKRHRHVKMGNFVRQYDPSANDKGNFLSIAQNNAPEKPFDMPLRLEVTFYFTRPKSHYKSGKNAHLLKDNASIWHTTKSDVDNLVKFVLDSLNKVYWRDDSIIASLIATKQYSDQPRIEINIFKL